MRQKLDIADVEDRTKIRAKYLRALENEEWGLLPGPTFVKTFLRTYAEVVGLDPHLLVEEYRTQHEVEEPPDLQPIAAGRPGRTPRRRAPAPPGPPGRLTVVLGLFAAIVVFLLVLGLTGGDDDGDGGDATEAAQTETTRTEPARTTPAKKPTPAPAGVSLRIAPDGPTYACLDTGEGTDRLFEGTLERPRTFRDARELRLNLGRRSVVLRANGKAVTVTPSPEPFGLRVTRAGAREITEGARPCA
jgi:cytoskeleton protein RodZ